jgi:2-polyprenyl-3-methyl-5-hydroxy-6-metoxy-1,4-benzoquinol methylase
MGVKLKRAKPRQIWRTVLYRLSKLPFAGVKTKQKIYLNLEWLFDRLAHENSFRLYDESTHPVRVQTKNFLLSKIKITDRVLDLGSDKGVMTNYIATKAARVVGIDNVEASVLEAKATYQKPNLEFITADALDYLNNTKEEFDVLILSHILEHLDNPKEFIFSFKRFFKYIFIELPDFDKTYSNHYRNNLSMQLIYTDDDHVTEFDRDELTQLIHSCNLKIVDSEFRYGVMKCWCEVL